MSPVERASQEQIIFRVCGSDPRKIEPLVLTMCRLEPQCKSSVLCSRWHNHCSAAQCPAVIQSPTLDRSPCQAFAMPTCARGLLGCALSCRGSCKQHPYRPLILLKSRRPFGLKATHMILVHKLCATRVSKYHRAQMAQYRLGMTYLSPTRSGTGSDYVLQSTYHCAVVTTGRLRSKSWAVTSTS